MGDAASGGHPVDRAGADGLHAARAVAMHNLALEKIGHGGETDMRMRPDIEAGARREDGRTHMVEKNEGPERAALGEGQHAAHLEPVAEIAGARLDRHLEHGHIGPP
jgi:hypothetical protein